MLSFMLYQNMGLNLYTKAQKSSIEWWYCFHVGRYYWTRSTTLSFLLILGTNRCMLCWLLVFGGPKCENHVRGFANSAGFDNMQQKAHRHPQVCWNHYLLLIKGLDLVPWTLSLGSLNVQMVAMLFSPV